MGLASQQKELCKFFCPFGQILGVELRQFQLDVRLGNRSARLPTPRSFGFTRIGGEERRDGEAIALHKTHIWANSLKPVCFLCFLLFWCPLLPFIETGTLKIYTKMILYMKNEIFDLNTPSMGLEPTLCQP